jgi:large subunit ribosomal protein L9
MEVILKEDVAHLGHIGEIVKVKDGYARNYLFPRGFAILADKRNVRELEHHRRVVEEKRKRVAATAQEVADKMAGVKLVFTARAGEGGKLFGSITNQDIEKELREQGYDFDRRRIRIEEPIKSVGKHKVTVTLAAGVPCEIEVEVAAMEVPAEEAAAEEAAAEKAAADKAATEKAAAEAATDTGAASPAEAGDAEVTAEAAEENPEA